MKYIGKMLANKHIDITTEVLLEWAILVIFKIPPNYAHWSLFAVFVIFDTDGFNHILFEYFTDTEPADMEPWSIV